LLEHPWAGRVEQALADASDRDAVREALGGVGVAYYLIHALGTGRTFEETDRLAAETFASAAADAGVRRIVYLGGLASREEQPFSVSALAQ
jgi:uncharacterized protein YbjT (DUF2867 family)